MQISVNGDVSLFVRDRATGRLVFNSEAVMALGLNPTELRQRGYSLSERTDPDKSYGSRDAI